MVSKDGELAEFEVVVKCFMVKKMGKSSQSKALCILSALVSFLEKKATGHQRLSRNCSCLPPNSLSDVSTVMLVFAFLWG